MLDAPVPTVAERHAIARIQVGERAGEHVPEQLGPTAAADREPSLLDVWWLWLPACLVVALVALVEWLRVVLDPFAGAGTVGLVATRNDRRHRRARAEPRVRRDRTPAHRGRRSAASREDGVNQLALPELARLRAAVLAPRRLSEEQLQRNAVGAAELLRVVEAVPCGCRRAVGRLVVAKVAKDKETKSE